MSAAPAGGAASSREWDAIAIHPDDNVAVALKDCVAGAVRVRRRGTIESIKIIQPIALGHKVALVDLPAGTIVRKYGEPIGHASTAIAAGDHVHIHNLASQRGRDTNPHRTS
jgi:altronate dehydratase small subunit